VFAQSKLPKIRLFIAGTTFGKSLRILDKADRVKILAVIAIQCFLAVLDLIGVAIVGVLGALAVSGVQGQQPGDRVSFVLRLIQVDDNSLQFQFAWLGILACILFVGKTAFSVVFSRKIFFFLSRRGAELSGKLTAQLLRQPLLVVQSRSQQTIVNSLTSGVSVVMLGVVGATVTIISDGILLVLLSVGLFIVDPVVASLTMVGFGIIGFSLYRLLHQRTRQLGVDSTALNIQSFEQVIEVLSSYREAVVRNRRDYYSRKIYTTRKSLADINAEIAFIPSISKYVIESSVVIGMLLLGAVQFALQDARYAVGILAVFMAASARIAPAVLRVQTALLQIKGSIGTASGTLQLIEEIGLAEIPLEIKQTNHFEYPGFNAEIEILDLKFSYPGSATDVISGIDLKIAKGQSVAIVGSSGAGKTTFVDLILGVLNPKKGSVKISGLAPSDVTKLWPGAISYIPQDVLVVNSTIRENVVLGYDSSLVGDSEVWEALRIAQLDEFVMSLTDGLDSYVGDRGTMLSGGQRQRLGIARAMFSKPVLLVMDEATSALDGKTESELSEAISRLKGHVTVILIAHRLSTIRNVDTVVYLEGGRVIAEGSFNEVKTLVPSFHDQAKLMGL
jgi:ABC-type multidrug transport system fused ATPase/permease subunit